MSTDPNDFRVEIIKGKPEGITGRRISDFGLFDVVINDEVDAPGEVLDITDRVPRDGMGSINRAAERDLLSFKTGDVTLTLRNHDAYFDDLFAFFEATTIWGLRIYRRGEAQFYGALIGPGSIIFDVKAKTVEVTAYGLSKLLDMQSAEDVRRAFADMSMSAAIAGATTLTLNSVIELRSGDVLHITDHVNAEDVTIKQVTSSTTVSLESALQDGYATGTVVECTTRFYRYKTIDYLVEQLYKQAFIGIADFRLDLSQFSRLAPSPVNISGFTDLTLDGRRGLTQKGGLRVQSIDTNGTYSQANPEDDWTQVDATPNGWYDWTKYYIEGSAEPGTHLRDPSADGSEATVPGLSSAGHASGVDFINLIVYEMNCQVGVTQLTKQTWTGAWSIVTLVSAVPVGAPPSDSDSATCEYDPVRNIVICSWTDTAGTNAYLYYWDVVGAAWVNMKPATDTAATGYYGPVYVADLDMILALRGTSRRGPAFSVCAFRGSVKLWQRTFPSCGINSSVADNIRSFYPTRSIRSVAGRLYGLCVNDAAVQIFNTGDQFVSYEMGRVYEDPAHEYILSSRINGAFCFYAYDGTAPRGHAIAAPFYAGVIEYADFDGMSVAEGLKQISVLANALPMMDDDLQGRFIARDLYDPGLVLDITDRVMERTDTLVWDETKQYVTVSGNDVEATSGDAGFSSDGIDLDSALIPNEAYAQALADDYFGFYSAKRRHLELTVHDTDGHIYRPLDRVTIDGLRYFVYESDHNLTDDTVQLTLLEDL